MGPAFGSAIMEHPGLTIHPDLNGIFIIVFIFWCFYYTKLFLTYLFRKLHFLLYLMNFRGVERLWGD